MDSLEIEAMTHYGRTRRLFHGIPLNKWVANKSFKSPIQHMFWNRQNRWVLTKILHAEFPFNFFDKIISKSNRPPRWHLDCGSDSFKLIYNVRIEAISSYPKRKHFQHYWACPTTSRWLLRLTTSYGPLINLGVFSRLNQISSSHCFVLLSFSLICRKENRMPLPFS